MSFIIMRDFRALLIHLDIRHMHISSFVRSKCLIKTLKPRFIEIKELDYYKTYAGCRKTGYYGPDCSLPCPGNCRYCHIETGACEGCKPGYQGHRCEQPCSPQFYGEVCSLKCGNCSNGDTCHHINGTCGKDCGIGVFGEKCVTPCLRGRYGESCSKLCYCDSCSRFSGICDGPCLSGWKGSECSKACETGIYGFGCKQKCSTFCSLSGICDHVTGACKQGCKSGWMGIDCLEVEENVDNHALYVVVGMLSICVIVIVLLMIYVVHLRRNNRRLQTSNTYMYQENKCEANSMEYVEENYDSIISTSNREYQELGVMRQQITRN